MYEKHTSIGFPRGAIPKCLRVDVQAVFYEFRSVRSGCAVQRR